MNKYRIPIIVLLALINVILFWPGSLYFLNDDFVHIPLTDQGTYFQTNSVRPLHELLVRFDLWLWGKNAFGFHITALVMHFIVCIQLYFLTLSIDQNWLKLDKKHAQKVSFLTVALFLIYAQSSESIAWILGRTPVLSAIFFLVTLQLFFSAKLKNRHLFMGWLSFAATLFTYEQSVLVPAILLWLAFLETESLVRQRKRLYAMGLVVVCGVYVIVRKLITAEVVGHYEGQNFVSFQLKNLLANAFRFFSRLFITPGEQAYFTTSFLIVLVIVATLIFLYRSKLGQNKTTAVFFITMITLLVAPVLSLGISTRSFESGRYLYLPSMFLVMMISLFVLTPSLNRKVSILILAVLTMYWLAGKYKASVHYRGASIYVKNIESKIGTHFNSSVDTLVIDSLKVSVHRLPVYRLGFKEGIKWLQPAIDTSKITIKHFVEN